MTTEIKTISQNRFLIIAFSTIPLIIGGTIALGIQLESGYAILLLLLVLPASIIGAQYFATSTTRLIIDDDKLVFKNREIDYKNIDQYFLNEEAPNMTAFELRLYSGEVVSITFPSIGRAGKKIKTLILELTQTIKNNNPNATETNYQGIHVEQMKFLRPIIFILIGIVLIIDLVAIFILLFIEREIPTKIFFINALILVLYPYTKKEKTRKYK